MNNPTNPVDWKQSNGEYGFSHKLCVPFFLSTDTELRYYRHGSFIPFGLMLKYLYLVFKFWVQLFHTMEFLSFYKRNFSVIPSAFSYLDKNNPFHIFFFIKWMNLVSYIFKTLLPNIPSFLCVCMCLNWRWCCSFDWTICTKHAHLKWFNGKWMSKLKYSRKLKAHH